VDGRPAAVVRRPSGPALRSASRLAAGRGWAGLSGIGRDVAGEGRSDPTRGVRRAVRPAHVRVARGPCSRRSRAGSRGRRAGRPTWARASPPPSGPRRSRRIGGQRAGGSADWLAGGWPWPVGGVRGRQLPRGAPP
jgi:hypothetical protein